MGLFFGMKKIISIFGIVVIVVSAIVFVPKLIRVKNDRDLEEIFRDLEGEV